MAYDTGKILGIDASRCSAKYGTGVEMYSRQIIRALLEELAHEAHPKFERVFLYTPREIPEEILGGRYPFVTQRIIQLPRLWTHVRLSLEMLHEEPDVLFVPSHVLPLHHAKHSVVTIHDVAFMEFPQAYSWQQRMYLKFSTWLAASEASRLIVPSRAVAGDLVKYFRCPRGKIEVISHGFEAEDDEEKHDHHGESAESDAKILEGFGILKDTKYIFYVGRLEEKKNIVRLVQAFLKFHEKHSEWRLILAGSRGFGFEKIFEEVERAKAWDCIMMPGYISEHERNVLYGGCAFVAFVSLAEGFGFPILEAMSFGKNVLASDTPVMHEVGGDCLLYVNPMSVDEITDGMMKLAGADIDVEKLMRVPKHFTWKRAGEETLRVLENVI